MIHFLFRHLKGSRFLIVLAIGLTIAQVGVALLAPIPLKFLLDKIVSPHQDPNVPLLAGVLHSFDHFDTNESLKPGEHTQLAVILLCCCMLVAIGLLTALFTSLQLSLASCIGQNLTAKLRKHVFGHLERLPLGWHGQQKKGDLVQRVTGNIADIEKLVTDGLVDLLSGVLIMVGVTAVMIHTNWQFTVLSLVIVPTLVVVVLGYTTSIKVASKQASKAAGQVASVATEAVGAITVLKAFMREEPEAIRFTRYVEKNRKAGLRAGSLQAQFTPLVAILLALGTALIVGVGAYVAGGHAFTFWFLDIEPGTVLHPTFTFGTLTVFLAYLAQWYQPLRDLSKLTTLYTSASAWVERIQEVLDAAPEGSESSAPYNGPTRLKRDIAFDKVIYGYTPNRSILKGITLTIPAGRKVALVGLSGGGKTTLVKLIARLYDIQAGSIRIDGVDTRLYSLWVLRQNVSMMLQDNVLFEGTIRENIALGKPGASDADILGAAKKAHIHETIMEMPDAYDTEVREQGKNFSGGQRQRLAIARAILRDAPILILDEPTAALDAEAETKVMHALDTLMAGRTVLLISHRLSMLGNVDEIIVLKDGMIIEQGTFEALKRKGGVFAGLLQEQNRYNPDHQDEQSMGRATDAPLPQHLASKHQAWILLEVDGKIIGEHQLNQLLLTVGRHANCDLQIPSPSVSRLHAKLRWQNGTWVMFDADSVNGLIYRGQRIEQRVLTSGDRISLSPAVVLEYKVY